jgi:hypothetical protein
LDVAEGVDDVGEVDESRDEDEGSLVDSDDSVDDREEEEEEEEGGGGIAVEGATELCSLVVGKLTDSDVVEGIGDDAGEVGPPYTHAPSVPNGI